jgi:DNA-directed RNA polymerase specialized sigma subunit
MEGKMKVYKEYNDYIRTVRIWMKEYNNFKAMVVAMNEDIAAQTRLLERADDLTAPIAKYDGMPRGGSGELNAVEAAAQDRIRRQQAIYKEMLNRDEVQRILDRVDRALRSLPEEDREVLIEFYIDKRSWDEIGYSRGYSERWARDKGGKALKAVAFFIFGVRAQPQQLSFVFLE